jgi:hypothetical protein
MGEDRSASTDRPEGTDRRTRPGLRFDPAARTLSLGDESTALPAHVGNQAVLRAYVDLAARCRGNRPTDLVEVRQNDLDALTLALDLDAADLAQQIERVLGATPAQAGRFADRLRANRFVGGAAKVAAGAVLAGSVLAGAGAVAAARAETPTTGTPATAVATSGGPATTTTTDMTAAGGWQSEDEPVIDGPLTTTPEGVGLIPPVTEDASGAVLVPPTTVERDGPGPS